MFVQRPWPAGAHNTLPMPPLCIIEYACANWKKEVHAHAFAFEVAEKPLYDLSHASRWMRFSLIPPALRSSVSPARARTPALPQPPTVHASSATEALAWTPYCAALAWKGKKVK